MYKFKKIDTDKYTLETKNKTIEFERKIDYVKKIQEANLRGNVSLAKYLADQKITANDLIIKKNDGKGHTYEDSSNYDKLLKTFTDDATAKIADELISEVFKMKTEDVMELIGIDMQKMAQGDEKEVNKFGNFITKFYTILSGNDDKTPSNTEGK